jgi:hypothetical protein
MQDSKNQEPREDAGVTPTLPLKKWLLLRSTIHDPQSTIILCVPLRPLRLGGKSFLKKAANAPLNTPPPRGRLG